MTGPSEPPRPPGIEVPDDARALDAEARALRRERRASLRERRRADRLAGRTTPSGRVVLLLLAGAALIGLLLALVGRSGRPVPPPPAAPLASVAALPGRAGALMPDVVLQGRARPQPARELRPGAFLLVSAGCDCVAAARQLARDAAPFGLVTYLVEAGSEHGQVEHLAASAGGTMAPFVDPQGVLASAFGLHTPAALVLVRADGVVTRVIDAIGPSLQLRPALRALLTVP